MEQSKYEFIQCLKILYYDYGLYDHDADLIERKSKHSPYKYKKKLPQSIVDKQEDEDKENENDITTNYSDMISMGLKTQKKFLMECPYLDIDILQCLLELKLLDESFIADRFRNTYDFMQNELNMDIKQCWNQLQNKVFTYNKNVSILRKMGAKEIKLLFRSMIRVIVSKEYRKWINDYIMNGDKEEDEESNKVDKSIQIKKRGEIEDKYKLPNNAILLIQSFV